MPIPRRMKAVASSASSSSVPSVGTQLRPGNPARASRAGTCCANQNRLRGRPGCAAPNGASISPEATAACVGCLEQRQDALGHRLEQLVRVFAVFEKTVRDQPQPRIEFAALALRGAEKMAHHEPHHPDERRGRGRQAGERFENGVTLAAELTDLAVERLLAREMLEQQRLRDAGGLGQLARRRARESLACEKRHRRPDDRLAALVAIQSNHCHCKRK